VPDGREPNPSDDQDGDGMINALDPDADDDGLFDGTELGFGCDDAATDAAAGTCVADGDGGATTTSSLARDTDFGGVPDGEEDANRNGVIDDGETDPNDAADDVVGQSCSTDADCGAADSGLVCDGDACGFGCRGEGGNGCPAGEECSSSTMEVGQCGPPAGDAGMPEPMMPDAGVDGMPGAMPDITPQGFLGGGGCDCRAAGGQGDGTTPLLVVAALLFVGRRRRRRF
jgi:MYXO-CTERM domain-containing protein